MSRQIERLTRGEVERADRPGLYPDGDGLYLQVRGRAAKSWVYRYMLRGRRRDMGLGSARLVSLSEARRRAHAWRRVLKLDRKDPIDYRRGAQPLPKPVMVFRQAAAAYIDGQAPSWKSPKHINQWRSSLKTYAEPILGSLPVDSIDTRRVLSVLEPIWFSKPETAGKVRMRIQAILDWAGAKGLRSGDNPARWEGHLDKLLPRRSKVSAVEHHAALPFGELPAFMADLAGRPGPAATALRFVILTGVRTSEALGARWPEIDLEQKVWTIPAERMKAGKEHKVPLSDQAVQILQTQSSLGLTGLVFPGAAAGRPMSNMAMLMMLRRMGREDLTVHGFRSTFRDWIAERTAFPSEVAEMALAHAIASKVEAAYRRGNLFDKRRELMTAWGRYCASAGA